MKKQFYPVAFSFILLVVLNGCSSLRDFPAYDQVLTYNRPYDFTFLKTMEALNTFPDWILEETDKNKGLIVLRNINYGNVTDRDKWEARFIVKSLGRNQTSVALEPDSQHSVQGGELLKRIDQVMAMSTVLKGEKQAQAIS